MTMAFAEELQTVVEKTVEAVPAGVKSAKLPLGEAVLDAALGYLVVFIGLVLLMIVVIIVGKIMVAQSKKTSAKTEKAIPAESAATAAAPTTPKKLAPGSAGDVKIYDTDPRDAAMIMAIVADKLDKPLNELRFRSIKEVK